MEIRKWARGLDPIQLPRRFLPFGGPTTTPRAIPWFLRSEVLQHLLGRDLAAGQTDGDAGARVGGSADEIQALDGGVPGRGAEREDVEEAVAQAQDGAFVQIEDLLPALRRVDDFLDERVLQALGAGARFDGGEDGVARFGDHKVPVLLAVRLHPLSDVVVEEMTDGHEHDDRVRSVRRSGRIDARGYVEVE